MNKIKRLLSFLCIFMMIMGVFSVKVFAYEPTSGDIAINGDFTNGHDHWYWTMMNTAEAYRYVNNGEFVVEIVDGGWETYQLQLNQPDLTITEGKQYAVYFDAKTTENSSGGQPSPRTIISTVGKAGKPWTSYAGAHTHELTTEMQRFSYTFTMFEPTDFRAQLSFQLGNDDRDVVIDNVAIYDLTGGDDPTPPAMPTPTATYDTLVWSDEFNGTEIDTTVWTHEIGGTGWGNNELQYYTDRPENSRVENGNLVIEARQESYKGKSYTSARLITENKIDFQYGRIEARIKLPYGQGMWPAFWMLGSNYSSVGWPACGEIDIMEMVGGGESRDDTTHGTIHWENSYGEHWSDGYHTQIDTGILADTYHTVSIVWDSSYIYWFLDGVQFNAISISESDKTEFHKPFFLLLNLAVGGNWPGSPDKYTNFPQKYYIDYIRVYQ
ncbi:hypothetical protein U472_07045 [Orenia metallireducens]|jgi:hypothetical protein|uniref:GH16 domain-containing protein n=1 Tax=Orenia metallireducens TaxID=1413210 RepID=A0A1C0AAD7_9FIRM|nr:glycoside hydrolase family 16 protein [Orenia metallireducens]OCL27219.1 hypothetical protein U472_07045 [Orenia metallireducens]